MILFENRASIVLYKVLKKIKNKKFLLPLNICKIVPDTLIQANKEFEFVDISLDTLCMNQDIVLQKLEEDKTIDGILFVKAFGIDFDIQPFYKTIKDKNHNFFIIDDMCLCIQQFNYDIKSSYADLALFSSGYSKYVDVGYGGYGFVKDNDFKNLVKDKSKNRDFLEYMQIVLERIKLMKMHKEELNNIYKNNIPEKYHLGEEFNNWRFSILIENKEEILKLILETDGLFASSHYPQVDFDYVKYPILNSNAHKIHSKIINLFNDFRFTKDKAYQIVDLINKYTKG